MVNTRGKQAVEGSSSKRKGKAHPKKVVDPTPPPEISTPNVVRPPATPINTPAPEITTSGGVQDPLDIRSEIPPMVQPTVQGEHSVETGAVQRGITSTSRTASGKGKKQTKNSEKSARGKKTPDPKVSESGLTKGSDPPGQREAACPTPVDASTFVEGTNIISSVISDIEQQVLQESGAHETPQKDSIKAATLSVETKVERPRVETTVTQEKQVEPVAAVPITKVEPLMDKGKDVQGESLPTKEKSGILGGIFETEDEKSEEDGTESEGDSKEMDTDDQIDAYLGSGQSHEEKPAVTEPKDDNSDEESEDDSEEDSAEGSEEDKSDWILTKSGAYIPPPPKRMKKSTDDEDEDYDVENEEDKGSDEEGVKTPTDQQLATPRQPITDDAGHSSAEQHTAAETLRQLQATKTKGTKRKASEVEDAVPIVKLTNDELLKKAVSVPYFSKAAQSYAVKYFANKQLVREKIFSSPNLLEKNFHHYLEERRLLEWATNIKHRRGTWVREFYANLSDGVLTNTSEWYKRTFFRGKIYDLKPSTIAKAVGVRTHSFQRKYDEEVMTEEVVCKWLTDNTQEEFEPRGISAAKLTTRFFLLYKVVSSLFLPSSNHSDVTQEMCYLMYAIDRKMRINYGWLVLEKMLSFAGKPKYQKTFLPYGSLITRLLEQGGAEASPTDELEYLEEYKVTKRTTKRPGDLPDASGKIPDGDSLKDARAMLNNTTAMLAKFKAEMNKTIDTAMDNIQGALNKIPEEWSSDDEL